MRLGRSGALAQALAGLFKLPCWTMKEATSHFLTKPSLPDKVLAPSRHVAETWEYYVCVFLQEEHYV